MRHSLEETIESLQSSFGAEQYSQNVVKYWWCRFQEGDYSCDDRQKGGKPRAVPDTDYLEEVAVIPAPTSREIAIKLGVSSSTVIRRLNALGYTLKLERWVPYLLTAGQKAARVRICADLLAKFQADEVFLK